jgi:hypothetical protein
MRNIKKRLNVGRKNCEYITSGLQFGAWSAVRDCRLAWRADVFGTAGVVLSIGTDDHACYSAHLLKIRAVGLVAVLIGLVLLEFGRPACERVID